MSDNILVDGVECRQVPGFPGYAVSACGKVGSCRTFGPGAELGQWRWIVGWLNQNGYPQVQLRVGGKAVTMKIHRLVLLAWVGPCPEGMECCHGDGVRTNNQLKNLRWGSHQDNTADQRRHGTQPKGKRNGRAKLSEADVASIRMRLASGEMQTSIASDFGVRKMAISDIKTGRNWSWLK